MPIRSVTGRSLGLNGRDQRGRRSECLSGFRPTVERSVSRLWNGHFIFENCSNASRGFSATKARFLECCMCRDLDVWSYPAGSFVVLSCA